MACLVDEKSNQLDEVIKFTVFNCLSELEINFDIM